LGSLQKAGFIMIFFELEKFFPKELLPNI